MEGFDILLIFMLIWPFTLSGSVIFGNHLYSLYCRLYNKIKINIFRKFLKIISYGTLLLILNISLLYLIVKFYNLLYYNLLINFKISVAICFLLIIGINILGIILLIKKKKMKK